MTSVTVAGGSFDLPRTAAKLASEPSKRDRWLRYGIGVSIAGLLAADGFVLTSMLRETAPARRAEATASTDAARTTAATSGSGFAAFDVPADFSPFVARYAATAAPAASAAAVPVADAPAPDLSTLTVPAATPTFSTPRIPAPGAPASGPAASSPDTAPPAPIGVVEQVAEVVAQVPEAGAPLAEVVAEVDAVEPVTEVVEAEVVEAEVAPAAAPVTAEVGGLL